MMSSIWECQGDPTAQIILDPSPRALEMQGRGHREMKINRVYLLLLMMQKQLISHSHEAGELIHFSIYQ